MAFARPFDHRAAHVDADAAGRLERGYELTRSAADLQHRPTRRDVEAVHVLDQAVVRAVAPPPAVGVLGEPVEELGELAVGRPRHSRRLR